MPDALAGMSRPDRNRKTRTSGASTRFGQPASGRLRHPLALFPRKSFAGQHVFYFGDAQHAL
jgi:hypothetical protein